MSYLGRKSGRAALISDDIPDNSITAAKIVAGAVDADIGDNAVTLAKMAGGTDGQIITYDASGDPIAVGPGTDGQVLTSTGAGSPPAFEAVAAGGAAGEGYFVASCAGGAGWVGLSSNAICPFDIEEVDDDGLYDTSAYDYTAPETGWYIFGAHIYTAMNLTANGFSFYVNGSDVNFTPNPNTWGWYDGVSDDDRVIAFSAILKLSATNYVSVNAAAAADFNKNNSWWWGCRIK